VPKRNARPDDLRALGVALAQWCRRESGKMLSYVNREALASLMNGTLPPPYLHQFETRLDELNELSAKPRKLDWLEQQRRQRKLRTDLGSTADNLTVFFQVYGGAYFNRAQTIASLRQEIPPELVEDIMINGKTWNQLV
jgi:hypothetical protein